MADIHVLLFVKKQSTLPVACKIRTMLCKGLFAIVIVIFLKRYIYARYLDGILNGYIQFHPNDNSQYTVNLRKICNVWVGSDDLIHLPRYLKALGTSEV